jgi:endoglucanase Acf2
VACSFGREKLVRPFPAGIHSKTRIPKTVSPDLSRKHLPLACAGLMMSCLSLPAEVPAGPIVATGAGSYTTVRPEGCEPLPEKIYRTEEVRGATPTGQWWSSLLWQEFSNNLFAHPLAMVATDQGLAVCYPGAAIVAAAEAIMGGGVTRDGDFRIGHSAVKAFPNAECGGHSDWFVTASFKKGEASMSTSFGHGSPYVYCRHQAGDPVLTFAEVPQVWSGADGGAVLGVTVKGNHYGLFGPAGSRWHGIGGKVMTNLSPAAEYSSIALLPDNRPETLELFRRHAHRHVTGTRIAYRVDGGVVKTRYEFDFKAWEDSAEGTVFALYPHQWKYSSGELTGMTYASVRGVMKVGIGSGFDTEVPVQGVLPMLPAEGIKDRERLLGYLRAEAAAKPPEFADTYWEGKYLGRLVSLSGIAEVAGATDLRDGFVAELRRRLENWFTASPGEAAPLFHYNSRWGTLVGNKASYGSDKSLNDHHFHYGYFIRAAAEVARLDPVWAGKWGPMVSMLIRDIASPRRDDPLFPFIRCFDKYAGHSWASGDANFADGNNQESSSESMNAWYGMILWGEITGDRPVRDTGLFLYNTERTAVEEYWFDVSGTNFPEAFPQVALGMVWGGKGAFATWFSPDIDCIHGINWLPFTPASIYMGRHPDYVRKNHDRIVSKREGGTDYGTGWGDLVVMFRALAEPEAAAAYIDAHPDCKLEGGNTHAFMYHWIHTLDRLGINDTGITADHPFTNVFQRKGVKTYVAWMPHDEPVSVRFSDGTVLEAKGKGLSVLAPKP